MNCTLPRTVQSLLALILCSGLITTVPSTTLAKIRDDGTPPGKSYTYKQSGGQPQVMEIYFPEDHDATKAKVPCVLMFHGGAWTGGNLLQFRYLCKYLASRGLVAATANYRLKAGKAVCVTDAKSAIRWMKSHAKELGIDPDRLIVGGGSAGGHIAFVATLTPELDDPQDPKDVDTSVVGYLLYNPAFSAKEGDPKVDAAKLVKPGIAPMIAFYGTNDNGKWFKGWKAVQKRLADTGNKAPEIWMAPGQGHGFFNAPDWQTITSWKVDPFLVSLGFLKGKPSLLAMDKAKEMIPGTTADTPYQAPEKKAKK